MDHVTLTLETNNSFPVWEDTGYPLYGALMTKIENVDPSLSERIHSAELASLNSSGLQGDFGSISRRDQKLVREDKKYQVTLGITDPQDEDVFRALLDTLMYDGEPINMSNGSLYVDQINRRVTSPPDILDQAANNLDANGVQIRFVTTTAIKDGKEVNAQFPHRETVFKNLVGKWNACDDEEHTLAVESEDILNNVYAVPEDDSFETNWLVTNIVEKEGKSNDEHYVNGFTGTVSYRFKDASKPIKTAIIATAMFGEYAGVGQATARGAGTVEVEVEQ